MGSDAVAMAAVAERIDLAVALLMLVAVLALFTVVLLLVGGREAHRPSLAVRSALGASPRQLVRHLIDTDARRLAVMAAGGLVAGLLLAGALRWSWPAVGGLAVYETTSITGLFCLSLLTVVPAVALIVTVALINPLPGLGARTPALLRRGRGVTDDPRAGTVRRRAATLQTGLSFGLAVAGAALIGRVPTLVGVDGIGGQGTISRYQSAGSPSAGDWPGSSDSPALLGTPGVWVGVGARDMVTVDCGACARGGLYLPVYGIDSTVHAVTPALFGALGAERTEGRTLGGEDGPDAPLVGVVNEAFRAHFEGGAPIGHRIRLSGPGDRWVEVVGVVADPDFGSPGSPGGADPVLWLPLAQHPASVIEGVVPGAPGLGWETRGPALSLAELRQASLAPIEWAGWVLLFAGIAASALAVASGTEVARVEAHGRARAGAVRLALGAPPIRPALRIARRTLSGAVQGVLLGLLVAWGLRAALGVGGEMGMLVPGVLAIALVAATLVGARRPIQRLLRIQPAVLLREE